jgi:tyrosine-protein phosphatase SIW14
MAMIDDREGSKQERAERAGKRRRYAAVFVAGVLLACGLLCLLQMGRYGGVVPFGDGGLNRTRQVQKKRWAPRLELAGVENFHRVSEQLYRGAQPTAEGMKQLKKLGIKTIVNLRSFHSDRPEIGDTGLGYEHIYMKTWHPEEKEVARFLQIVTDANRTPAFVHCQRGADRTGTMCAIYRAAVEDWSKDEAIEEMTKGGFGFYSGWQNLIDYVRRLDIDGIRMRAGLEAGQ